MILNCALPYDIHQTRPLPGVQPLGDRPVVLVNETYADQMALRRRLLDQQRSDVLALSDDAVPVAQEALRDTVERLPDGFDVFEDQVICPDGVAVSLNLDDPLATIGRIVQEDICLLEKRGDTHVLTGAVLCFPASWMLSEKFMHPLIGIHEPVATYDAEVARRVQRLFDGIRVGHPLWRFNALWYEDPALFQPRSQFARRVLPVPEKAEYLRSEMQILRRLPETSAVVFSIHTFVLKAKDVESPEQEANVQ